jgi:hypothetical protein
MRALGQLKAEDYAGVMDKRHPLTEAEYIAWMNKRMPEIADEITERFQDVLPEGARFEWGPVEPEPERANPAIGFTIAKEAFRRQLAELWADAGQPEL